MADPLTPQAPTAGSSARGPALPSTADTVPYVPVSWMAVGAMLVSLLYLVVLLVGGIDAAGKRRPLLMPELLVLPVVAVVLSFAARRIVTNSEGTRTGNLFGIDLPAAAWWIAVVGGFGYTAYLLAIDYAVRRDAQAEVERWAETLGQIDAALVASSQDEDPNLTKAFYRTRDPNERAGMSATDAQELERRWSNEFIAFRRSDLVRILLRNPGQCQLTVGGIHDWSQKSTGVECVYTLTLTCPEGVFPMRVPLKGVETGSGSGAAGGRQWQIVLGSSGFVNRAEVRLTPYGHLISQLEAQGADYGRRFVNACTERQARPYAFIDFAEAGADPALVQLTHGGMLARFAALGITAGLAWSPSDAVFATAANRLFTQLGGARPNESQAKTFQEAWSTVGFTLAGSRLQGNPDVHPTVRPGDKSIEVLLPIEIPLNAVKGAITAARGRVVLLCTTPGVAEEATRLREEARKNPGQTSSSPPDDIRRKNFTWKVLRVESDLKPIQVDRGPQPGGGDPSAPVEGP